MIYRILHAPVEEFLEIVPIGRILNRFTKDIDVIDKILMKNFGFLLYNSFLVFSDISFMIIAVSPLIAAPISLYILLAFYYRSQSMSIKRDMVRLEAVSKSPIITWAAQTI